MAESKNITVQKEVTETITRTVDEPGVSLTLTQEEAMVLLILTGSVTSPVENRYMSEVNGGIYEALRKTGLDEVPYFIEALERKSITLVKPYNWPF